MTQATYVKTGNGDFLSKEAKLFGISNIAVKGKSIIKQNVTIRGDLRRSGGNSLSISFGNYWPKLFRIAQARQEAQIGRRQRDAITDQVQEI